MKSLREKFEEEYAPVAVTLPNGKVKIHYVYDAPWYLWNIPEKALRRKKYIITGLSVGSLILFIGAALLPSETNQWRLIAIAGLISLALHVLEMFGVLRFLFAKVRTTKMNYSYINEILGIVPWLRGVSLLVAFGLNVYYMGTRTVDFFTVCISVIYVVCAASAFALTIMYGKIPISREKNHMEYCEIL